MFQIFKHERELAVTFLFPILQFWMQKAPHNCWPIYKSQTEKN